MTQRKMNPILNTLDDLTGKTFGLLAVVERAEKDSFGNIYWRCVCKCGEKKLSRASTLRAGKFFTCGKQSCRFWEKVHVPSSPDSECSASIGWCWEWTGALKDTGYGVLKIPGLKKNVVTHVYAYEQFVGPIPDKLWVLHECDNRKCVRASHLFLGTHKDNMRDMAEKGRACSGKGSKPQLSPERRLALLEEVARGLLSYPQLAVKYGVTTRTITRIVTGH